MAVPTAGGKITVSQYDTLAARVLVVETAGDAGQMADSATAGNTTSTSYTSTISAGSCPSVTVSLVSGQNCLVTVSADCNTSVTTLVSRFSFAVSGAATEAATDARSCGSTTTSVVMSSRTTLYTAGATGSFTFQSQVKASAAGTAATTNRRIIAQPMAYPT